MPSRSCTSRLYVVLMWCCRDRRGTRCEMLVGGPRRTYVCLTLLCSNPRSSWQSGRHTLWEQDIPCLHYQSLLCLQFLLVTYTAWARVSEQTSLTVINTSNEKCRLCIVFVQQIHDLTRINERSIIESQRHITRISTIVYTSWTVQDGSDLVSGDRRGVGSWRNLVGVASGTIVELTIWCVAVCCSKF